MDPALRRAWTEIVVADELDAHMQANGQARVNAELVEAMLTRGPTPVRRTLLFAGAGTGQLFDYVGPSRFERYRVTFTDINGTFLDRLRDRLAGSSLDYETVVDDIEQPTLRGPFGGAVVVLVLEHVDWRRGVDGLASLEPEVIHLVVQQNAPGDGRAVGPGSPAASSIAAFAAAARPVLVDVERVLDHLGAHGYGLVARHERAVPGGKTMVGLTVAAAERPRGS